MVEDEIKYKEFDFNNQKKLTNKILKEIYDNNYWIHKNNWTIEEYAKELRAGFKSKNIIFLAYNNKKCIGGIIGRKIDNKFHIGDFFIDSTLRKKQIGEKIFFRMLGIIRTKTNTAEITLNSEWGFNRILTEIVKRTKRSKSNVKYFVEKRAGIKGGISSPNDIIYFKSKKRPG